MKRTNDISLIIDLWESPIDVRVARATTPYKIVSTTGSLLHQQRANPGANAPVTLQPIPVCRRLEAGLEEPISRQQSRQNARIDDEAAERIPHGLVTRALASSTRRRAFQLVDSPPEGRQDL